VPITVPSPSTSSGALLASAREAMTDDHVCAQIRRDRGESMTAETDHEAAEDEAIAIDANGETTLPVIDVLTGRAFLTGKSGSGKSNSVSVVAE
jgi:hypothetical protein